MYRGRRKLEWPQEVGCLLEGRAHSVDLMDQVLNADDVVLAKSLLNDAVVDQWNAALVNLQIPDQCV